MIIIFFKRLLWQSCIRWTIEEIEQRKKNIYIERERGERERTSERIQTVKIKKKT